MTILHIFDEIQKGLDSDKAKVGQAVGQAVKDVGKLFKKKKNREPERSKVTRWEVLRESNRQFQSDDLNSQMKWMRTIEKWAGLQHIQDPQYCFETLHTTLVNSDPVTRQVREQILQAFHDIHDKRLDMNNPLANVSFEGLQLHFAAGTLPEDEKLLSEQNAIAEAKAAEELAAIQAAATQERGSEEELKCIAEDQTVSGPAVLMNSEEQDLLDLINAEQDLLDLLNAVHQNPALLKAFLKEIHGNAQVGQAHVQPGEVQEVQPGEVPQPGEEQPGESPRIGKPTN